MIRSTSNDSSTTCCMRRRVFYLNFTCVCSVCEHAARENDEMMKLCKDATVIGESDQQTFKSMRDSQLTNFGAKLLLGTAVTRYWAVCRAVLLHRM